MTQIHVRGTPPSQQQPQAAASTSRAASDELGKLASLLANAPKGSDDAILLDVQLGRLVCGHLAAGRNAVLVDALQKAHLLPTSAAYDELGAHIEYEAEHLRLGLRPDGRLQEARLFAIPVLVPNVALLGTGHIPVHPATDDLVASMRVCELIAPSQGMTLIKYLYHPDELDALAPSDVYRLAHQLALAERDEVPCSTCDVPKNEGTPGLRYLVGVVTGPVSPQSLLLADDEPNEEAAVDWVNKVSQWCAYAAKFLESAFAPLPESAKSALPVEVFPVGGFFEARRMGESLYKGSQALASIVEVLRITGIAPQSVHAIVAPYILEDQSISVVASMTSKLDGSLLGTAEYPVAAYEQLDTSLNDVHCMLESRVGEVAVVDTLVQFERCECCGDPKYLTPKHPESAHGDLSVARANSTLH
jgi:hypothetical protein